LYRDLKQAIADYKSTGNAQIIHEAIEERIAASVRSVDALLAQGESRRLAGGGIELEMRTIEGISYCVRVRNHSAHPGRLHVRIPVTLDGKQYLSSVPQLGRLTRQQITALRYRFSTDGWKTSQEARARLTSGEGTGLVIDFGDLSVSTSVGRLEGSFCMRAKGTRGRKVRAPLFGSYVFAIPDRQEFTRLLSPGSADGPSSAGDLIS